MRPLAAPVSGQDPEPINRRSDREQNVQSYWATQTPQSHHIVGVYRNLYRGRSPLFHPLWDISRVILAESGLGVR